MQSLPEGAKDEEGCFVYEVVGGNAIDVRQTPDITDESRTNLSFSEGELVSIDFVLPSRVPGSTNGPFLRLSDGSGWLFEKKRGSPCLRRIPVETGLFVVFVDNYPAGQAARRHPVDRNDLKSKNVYHPMQKLYCDRKVNYKGVNYYRVQGTPAWVFDVRPQKNGKNLYMLLDESMIMSGLFAFRASNEKGGIGIRKIPDVGEKSRTGHVINEKEIIVVDIIRQSPYNYGNGPFLRLLDGSGWVFENKGGEKVLEEVPIESGRWKFRVQNGPVGIGLRQQPIDSQQWRSNVSYEPGTSIVCDRKIKGSSGVSFFRVEGTEGWVFDKRDGKAMMTLIESGTLSSATGVTTDDDIGWTPDYVRGAADVCGLEEISFNPTSRVISFRNSQTEKINVYYTTRTVGTALGHPVQGKTQLFRRNCSNSELISIMNNPRVHTGKGYQRKRSLESSRHGSALIVDGEDEERRAILDCEEEIANLQVKRQRLLSSVRSCDVKRQLEASRADKKRQNREHERKLAEEKKKQEKKEAERKQKIELERKRKAELESYLVFSSPKACSQHFLDVHGYHCHYCYRAFETRNALYQHQDALGHW